MPLLIPAVLAALGLGVIAYAAHEDGKKPAPAPDRPVPPELMGAVQALLQNGRDPAAMEQMAATMDSYGYTNIAEQLRARANELRLAYEEGRDPPPPEPVFTATGT